MRDHLQEAIDAVVKAQNAVSVIASDVVAETSARLADELRPHCTLSEDDLQQVASACAKHTAAGVLGAAADAFTTMLEVMHAVRAQAEAVALPDTIPPEWTI